MLKATRKTITFEQLLAFHRLDTYFSGSSLKSDENFNANLIRSMNCGSALLFVSDKDVKRRCAVSASGAWIFMSLHSFMCLFVLFCVRAVVVETVISDEKTTTHFPAIPSLTEDTVVKSLVLVVQQKQPEAHLTLYLDCHHHGALATPRTLRQMFQRSKRLHVVSSFVVKFSYIQQLMRRRELLPLGRKDQYSYAL